MGGKSLRGDIKGGGFLLKAGQAIGHQGRGFSLNRLGRILARSGGCWPARPSSGCAVPAFLLSASQHCQGGRQGPGVTSLQLAFRPLPLTFLTKTEPSSDDCAWLPWAQTWRRPVQRQERRKYSASASPHLSFPSPCHSLLRRC